MLEAGMGCGEGEGEAGCGAWEKLISAAAISAALR